MHLARLADGTELAIKVQYPGAAEAVRADLANTDLLASVIKAGLALLGPHAPRLDPKLMVAEIRDRVDDELDYRIEAANQQEFHALYDRHPFIHIPAVYSKCPPGGSWPPTTSTPGAGRKSTAAGDALRCGGARPSSVSCSPACTDTVSSTPTPTPGTTSSTTTAPSPFSTSVASTGSRPSGSRSCPP